jgi:hypothetical protein
MMETPVPSLSASFLAREFAHSAQSHPCSTILVTGPSGKAIGVLSADEVNCKPELLAPTASLGASGFSDCLPHKRPTLTSYLLSATPAILSFSFPPSRIIF